MATELSVWLHNNPYDSKQEAKPHSDAILQQLLQNTMNTSNPVQIQRNQNGKPYVDGPVFFSHSNSAHLYAYVVTKGFEIAIDVEVMKPQRDVLKVAQRHFHPDELDFLQTLNAKQLHTAFYELWTKKEAWCKLDGGTLWSYMHRSVLPESTLKTTDGQKVYIHTLSDIKGFACSLAAVKPLGKIWLNNLAVAA